MLGSKQTAAADPAGAPGPSRRRLPLHIVLPVLVAGAVGALLLFAAAESLRPVREVAVRPVVYAAAEAPPAAPEPGASESDSGPTRAVQAAGWLEPDPFSIAATALADGVVEEVLVLEGERVERGDVLARLVADDARLALSRAQADLAAAEAELVSARADFAAAETDWENPVERERAVGVARAALAETEAELAQLPSLVAEGEAELARLNEELRRLRQAHEQGAATDIEVIILEKRAEGQAAAVAALRQQEEILAAQRDRLRAELRAAERNAELRVMERQALDASRARVARAEAAVAQAEAARDEAQLRLDRMVIRAPISGFVQSRLKAPGDKVMLGMDDPWSAHIAHLYDPAKLQVRVDVPLADAAHVRVGQPAEVVVEVAPDTTFRGEVTRITHEADLQKNTLQVKVRVIDPSPLLKPEMLTRVKFLAGRGGSAQMADAPGSAADLPEVLVAPDAVARNADGSATIWTIRSRRAGRGEARPVAVQIRGEHDDGWLLVSGAVRAGDLAIVSPGDLRSGEIVKASASTVPAPSARSPQEGGAS